MTTLKPTRFGPQPVREIIRKGKYSISMVAEMVGVREAHFVPALYGRIRPNMTVRERLPKVLGVPIEQLFTAEALSAPPNYANPRTEPAQSGARGPYRPRPTISVKILREEDNEGAQVVTLVHPLVRGDVYRAVDGAWVVWDAWCAHTGQYHARLRRTSDLRLEEWPFEAPWPAG
jgi:hypothetical protein